MSRILAAAAVALLATAAPAQVWTELGPAPNSSSDVGRCSAIATSATNPLKIYAAGADGGVWRTSNGGTTWTPLTNNMPTSSIGALALDPKNDAIVYVGTGEGNHANHSRYGLGIYKSTDGGNSWTHHAEQTFGGRCFTKLVINPANTSVMYASITRAGGFPEMAAAKGHPGAAGALGIFKSTDAGVTWTQLLNGLPNQCATDVAIDVQNPQNVYAAIGRIFGAPENGVYKSTNHGQSWTKLGGGLPSSNLGRISIAVAPSNGNRLYALITNKCSSSGGGASEIGAYRSDNGGTTWTSIGQGVDQQTYGWFLSFVFVHPTNPDTAFFGGFSATRTTNAGGNYSEITPPHVDMHACAMTTDGKLLIGDDGGVHVSTNLGNSWASLNSMGTMQLYAGISTHPTNDEFVIGGFQDNGTNRRTTNSMSWGHVAGGDGGWTQVDQKNPQIVFAESQGTGVLYKSTNGGASFNGAGGGINGNDRNCFLPPYLIDPANSQRMLYATHRIWQSTNAGNTFTVLSGDLTGGGSAAIRAIAIAPSDSKYVYAATNDGRVLSSTDSGATFTLRLSDAAGWPRVTNELFVSPKDPKTVYLAGARFGVAQVRRSTDGGATWKSLDGDLPDIPVNVIAVDTRCATPVIFAGTDAGVYRSQDGGATWKQFGAGLPNACFSDLVMDEKRSRLLASTLGRGVWRVPVSIPGDFDGNGVKDVDDFIAFQTAFAVKDPAADFDGDGEFTIDDFIAFQTAYALACP